MVVEKRRKIHIYVYMGIVDISIFVAFPPNSSQLKADSVKLQGRAKSEKLIDDVG